MGGGLLRNFLTEKGHDGKSLRTTGTRQQGRKYNDSGINCVCVYVSVCVLGAHLVTQINKLLLLYIFYTH